MLIGYMCQEKKQGENLPTSIQRLEDFIENVEKNIKATKNNTENTRTIEMTITRNNRKKNSSIDVLGD